MRALGVLICLIGFAPFAWAAQLAPQPGLYLATYLFVLDRPNCPPVTNGVGLFRVSGGLRGSHVDGASFGLPIADTIPDSAHEIALRDVRATGNVWTGKFVDNVKGRLATSFSGTFNAIFSYADATTVIGKMLLRGPSCSAELDFVLNAMAN